MFSLAKLLLIASNFSIRQSPGKRHFRLQSLYFYQINPMSEIVDSTKVKVKQGIVVGGESVLPNGGSYSFFKGIPYAVPPLAELRFKAPVPLESFSVPEIDCTKEGAISVQECAFTGKLIGSEDCLFLNVYTPKVAPAELLPVMVYLHGGGYSVGSGNSDWYNPLYLMQENVVVVTLNYRLGLLGFLSLPEGGIPGNAGLKDQRLALQWVKENISQFNGDPNNVTLFGESAGGASAHYHVLSDNSRNLFHKAILQSGLGNMPWGFDFNGSAQAKKLAQIIGCSSDDPFEICEFLQNFSDLEQIFQPYFTQCTFVEFMYGRAVPNFPVVEKESREAVITKTSLESMNATNTIDIPLMMGYTTAEGLGMLSFVGEKIEDFDVLQLIPRKFNLNREDPKSLELANAVQDFYFGGVDPEKRTLTSFVDLLGDFFTICDASAAAEIHSRRQHRSPLFFYRFDYDGSLNLFKNKIFRMRSVKGAAHGDDLFYIFQAAIGPEPWEDEAKQMVESMCNLWANFAKFSNPTPKGNCSRIGCIWEPVEKIYEGDKFTLNAFILDLPQRMLENPYEERMEFWRSLNR